ncbi:MAG: response regulator [Anaerolineaceae bacterium]|nr:response regulator [Anaerolineaceae bacterium]
MPMILLIEDEQDLRENLVDTLTFEGYDLITAANGLQGIELAAAHEPDLILSDIMMPKMDGYSALVALQKDDKTAHIPVIFLSAANDRSYIRHGMELGAEDYLTKPFTHAELLSTIKARLQRNDVRGKHLSETISSARKNLARRVVHEMRSPLVSLNIVQEVFSRQFEQMTPEMVQEYLAIQREGSQRLTHLVEQMVFLNELDSGTITAETVLEHRRPIPIADLFNVGIVEAKKFSYHHASKSIKNMAEAVQKTLNVETRLLKHALGEVISNALIYSPPDKEVELNYWVEDTSAYLSVLDHGPGIPARELPIILSQGKNPGDDDLTQQGMGFGLYLARMLVDLHQGMLIVNSQEGRGTQIVMKLPID